MIAQTDRSAHLNELSDALRARIASGRRQAVAHGKPVRLLTVSKHGVRVRYPDGHIEVTHPEDVR